MAAATASPFTTPNERVLSGAMALVMHLLFLALLIFGVSWQKRQPEAMVVDLWNNLPPMAAPKAEPAPEVKPQPPPPRPEPVAKPEPKPVPKVEPKPAPKAEAKPTVKPDIALKDKKEKEEKARKAAELELEKKRRAQEQAQIAALKVQQAKEADAKQQAAREQEEALRKLAQQAAAQDKMIDEYKARIAARVKARIIRAGCQSLGNPEIQLRVILLPDGNVLGDPEVKKSSGTPACDSAVQRAVLSAQPLPVPADPALFQKTFRDLNFSLRPND